MTQLFLDTEFSGLHRHAYLLSLALVPASGPWFYAVFADADTASLSDWHQDNVVPYLRLTDAQLGTLGEGTYLDTDTPTIVVALRDFLATFEAVEMWADVPAYDWVLFCELFGGALNLPRNVHYIVRDLATLFTAKGLDVDTDRFGFAYGEGGAAGAVRSGDGRAILSPDPFPEGRGVAGLVRHCALGDAMASKLCWLKLHDNG